MQARRKEELAERRGTRQYQARSTVMTQVTGGCEGYEEVQEVQREVQAEPDWGAINAVQVGDRVPTGTRGLEEETSGRISQVAEESAAGEKNEERSEDRRDN